MDDSTTDNGASNTGASTDALPESQTGVSAEQQSDAASGGNSQDNGNQKTDDSSNGEQSDTKSDDGLAKFAKSQGFDPDSLTENERRALKIAHDNQRDFHKKRQEEAGSLRDTVKDLTDPSLVTTDEDSPEAKERKQLMNKVTQLEKYQQVNEFWRQNPDAKEYEADMIKLIQDEKEQFGIEAAYHLSQNYNRLYKLARAERDNPDSLREAGRKEEREELRRKQEGSADTGSASSTSSRKTGKVDQDWIDNTYDPSNADHRRMLDSYLAG